MPKRRDLQWMPLRAEIGAVVKRVACIGVTLLTGCAGTGAGTPVDAPASLANLCVTDGRVEDAGNGRMRVSTPKMRAYLNGGTSDAAALRFTYLGPTAALQPLASGTLRVQFGLKLRAQDPCNLVYVMWRVEPESRLAVSVKSNPAQHLSSGCGNHGYLDLKPDFSAALPALRGADSHELSAAVQADELEVYADGRLVWHGMLGPIAAPLKGPAGVRSDNARLQFTLSARLPTVDPAPLCHADAAEDD
jgi:hypothetical protein